MREDAEPLSLGIFMNCLKLVLWLVWFKEKSSCQISILKYAVSKPLPDASARLHTSGGLLLPTLNADPNRQNSLFHPFIDLWYLLCDLKHYSIAFVNWAACHFKNKLITVLTSLQRGWIVRVGQWPGSNVWACTYPLTSCGTLQKISWHPSEKITVVDQNGMRQKKCTAVKGGTCTIMVKPCSSHSAEKLIEWVSGSLPKAPSMWHIYTGVIGLYTGAKKRQRKKEQTHNI